jgi:tripartite-type tricarboxylate transporter receptor subunit TctC
MTVGHSIRTIAHASCVVFVSASATALPAAAAQSYPDRPIRFIVGQPTGGGQDIVARAFAQQLAATMGQSVIVDNRPGASGTVGAAIAAKAAPDGYTALFVASTFAINTTLYKNLPYDQVRDFQPLTLIASTPFVLLLHPSIPVRTVKELIAYAKERPGQLNYASGGIGNSGHLAAALFCSLAGVELTHIPYKGTGQAMPDLLAGRVQILFNSALQAVAQVRQGQLRALAVTTTKRVAVLPDLPTMAEAGVPGYEFSSWYGALLPAGTPTQILNKLSAEARRAIHHPEFRSRLAKDGAEAIGSTPREFAPYLASEMARWAKVTQSTGMKVE